MSQRRAIRLLGPITLGTALVGAALLTRSCAEDGGDEELRRWNDEARADLPRVARQAAQDSRRAGMADDRGVPEAVQRAVQARDGARGLSHPLSPKARTRASGSDTAMAVRLANQGRAFAVPQPLIPPAITQAASEGRPLPLASLAPRPDPLPLPAFGNAGVASSPAAATPTAAGIVEAGGITFITGQPVVQPLPSVSLVASAALPVMAATPTPPEAAPSPALTEVSAASLPVTGQPAIQTEVALAPAPPLARLAEPTPAPGPSGTDATPILPDATAAVAPTEPERPQFLATVDEASEAAALPPPMLSPAAEAERAASLPSSNTALPRAATATAPAPVSAPVTLPVGPAAVPTAALATSVAPAAPAAAGARPALSAPVPTLTPVSAPVAPMPAVAAPAPAAPTANAVAALAAAQSPPMTFPSARPSPPAGRTDGPFGYDDELIVQVQVAGQTASDTLTAYGTRQGLFLPLGDLAMILDLAIRVSDDGNYASGWFLSEDRTLTIDLRQNLITTPTGTIPLEPGMAQAFDGQLYLRSDLFERLMPLRVEADMRALTVTITTLEPFPFEERMRREALRNRLDSIADAADRPHWPREETPYLPLSVPMADVSLRAVSDSSRGERGEGEVLLAGDLAYMTAQAYLGATTREGLVSSVIELGRRDPDGDMLGPLDATEFRLGDVASAAMPMGLRGSAGRGAFITNEPLESLSVFERIDLRGVLPDGYEVELYRNDVLLGSTSTSNNGQFEFLETPVDYGLNVFRLVFYGPQGQRREEVRQVTVGDGRLAAGDVRYSFGAVQRGVNLLGVKGPDFNPGARYGDWQAVANMAAGLSMGVTAVTSLSLFQQDGRDRWMANAGLRTGFGSLALRADAGLAEGGGYAAGLGLGGRAMGGSFALSHFEYGGGFIDEVHSLESLPLSRASELDFNTSIKLGGGEARPLYLPLTLRARRVERADGSTQTSAALRSSTRLDRLLVSNTVQYLRSASGGLGLTQVLGNFDLASIGRSDTQVRTSLGYRVSPDPRITAVVGQVDQRIDDRSFMTGSVAYAFEERALTLGLSGARELDRFTLAFESSYTPRRNEYAVGLRLNFSLGHDPLRGRFFVNRPGMAASGAAMVRAFQDLDGDRHYTAGDQLIEGVAFSVANATATTDATGTARLVQLGNGNRTSLQTDPNSLPDISLAPISRGVEIVPRPGRFHVTDFPIVSLSELEGTVTFADDASHRGVSGLRLQLRDATGQIAGTVRSERGGYYFFEQVRPGHYALVIEEEQARRLGVCLTAPVEVDIPATGDFITRDLEVVSCAGEVSPASPTLAHQSSAQ